MSDVMILAHAGGWGHMWGPGSGWMWLWGPLMLVFWLAVIAAAVWLINRAITTAQGPRERSGADRAEEVLAERYARGEITTEEYRKRLEQLR